MNIKYGNIEINKSTLLNLLKDERFHMATCIYYKYFRTIYKLEEILEDKTNSLSLLPLAHYIIIRNKYIFHILLRYVNINISKNIYNQWLCSL